MDDKIAELEVEKDKALTERDELWEQKCRDKVQFSQCLNLCIWFIDLSWLTCSVASCCCSTDLILLSSYYRTHKSCPCPPLDNTWVMVIVWRLRGNIIRTALYWIVWHSVHSQQHNYSSSSYRSNRLDLSHWDPYTCLLYTSDAADE